MVMGKQIFGIGHYEKKTKNGCHFVNVNMCNAEKFKITNPYAIVWVSGFPSFVIIGGSVIWNFAV